MDHYFQRLLRDFAQSGDPEIAMKIAHQALRQNEGVFPGYLAIGVNYETDYTFSRCVQSIDNPQQIHDYLAKEDRGSLPFDEILLVVNDADCPSIIKTLVFDRDYHESTPVLPELIEGELSLGGSGEWVITFETHDLEYLDNTEWGWNGWNVNQEDNIAQLNLTIEGASIHNTDDEIEEALESLRQRLRADGYHITSW